MTRLAIKPVHRADLLRLVRDVMRGTQRADTSVPAPEATPRSGLSLLVAEDFADNRVLVEAYLQGTPHQVVFAFNGRHAVELYREGAFDLIIMDIQLPEMDGLAATRAIRAIEAEESREPVPILACSAHAHVDAVSDSVAAGCTSHLAKPFSKAALLSALDTFGAHRLQGEARSTDLDVQVPDDMQELAVEYLESRRADIPRARHQLATGGFSDLRVLGHNIAGSGTSYGFAEITRLGHALVDAARAGDAAACAAGIDALDAYVGRASLALGIAAPNAELREQPTNG
ncbi:MAG: response regulator [Vicinamibacterales bacterium]